MKVKIIEKSHELDLEDEVNDFLDNHDNILSIDYRVAITSLKDELEYTFSCFIVYDS